MKKFYSIMLVTVALLFSANVLAQNVAKNLTTGAEYETLQAAVKAAAAGQTIQLIADINCAQGVYVDKSMTIDLNGFTYQSEGAKDAEANQDVSSRNLKIVGNGTVVTVKNGTMIAYAEAAENYKNKTGQKTGKGNLTTYGAYGTIRTEAGSTVNLENLELYNYHPWGLNMKICATNDQSLTNLEINPSTANIKNCKVYSNIGGGIEVAGGVANIESTEFVQIGKNLRYGYIACNVAVSELGRLTVNTTSFKSTGDHSIYVYSSGGLIQVESGVFAGVTDVINITKADAATVATNMYDNYETMSADDKALAREQAQRLITQFVTELGGTDTDNASQIIVKDGDFDGKITVTEGTKLGIEGGTFVNTGLTDQAFNAYLAEGVEVVTNPDGSQTVATAGTVKNDFADIDDESVVNITTNEEITGVVTVKQVNIGAGSSITVKEGGELHINGQMGAIVANGGQLKVEKGGKLVLESGLVHNGDASSLVIESQEGNTASLLIAPNTQMYGTDHPMGTINFTAKSYKNGEKYVWQRFGVPTFDGNTTMTWNGTKTWVHQFNYATDQWNRMIETTTGSEDFSALTPFACYNMTNEAAAAGVVYTFSGSLMGNQNAQLNMVKGATGWNYFANSYTAPIDIYAMLHTLKANYGSNVSATVYVYRAEDNWWDLVNLADVELAALGIGTVPQTTIDPMQSFILYLYNGTEAQAAINYNDDVFAPATTAAPRRVASNNVNNAIRFTVANSLYTDYMNVIEGANFSDNFDNGYDAQKYMSESNFNLYAVTADGEMSTVATNDIEGTRLAFNAAQAGNYTISFNTNAANYALKDNATNAIINIVNGATYSFNAEAGVNEARFSIIARADAPTALENTNANVKRAGIYTLQGQYLGETSMFNTLPQGVYVVDGKKVVR